VAEILFAQLARRSRNSGERRWHALICSYFDDSGDERGKRFVSSGGIVGEEEFVDIFEGMWIAETKELKEPFRSTECECQHGQFKDWPKEKCDALMTRLTDLICLQSRLVGAFCSIVPIPLYREVFSNSADDDSYRLAVAHTISRNGEACKKETPTRQTVV